MALLVLSILGKLEFADIPADKDNRIQSATTRMLARFLKTSGATDLRPVQLRLDWPIWQGWTFQAGHCHATALPIDAAGELADAARQHRQRGETIVFINRGESGSTPPRMVAFWQTVRYRLLRPFDSRLEWREFTIALIAPPNCAATRWPWAQLWQ